MLAFVGRNEPQLLTPTTRREFLCHPERSEGSGLLFLNSLQKKLRITGKVRIKNAYSLCTMGQATTNPQLYLVGWLLIACVTQNSPTPTHPTQRLSS
jgi:hypothetical protein